MKKQVEEMAKLLCIVMDGDCDYCRFSSRPYCPPKRRAERVYNAGYRKQSECDLVEVANWAGSIEYKCTACKEGFFHAEYYQYCPFCGAKRKGGE